MDNQPVAIEPWKDLAPKQKELMRLCRYKTGAIKLIGVFGTRKAGKSIGCENAICDHLWTTREAQVLILCRTQGDGTTGGIWSHLTEKILPRWMEFPIGEDYMTWAPKGEPRATIAKKMVCATTNMHGGVSKLMLDSLDDEREVEKYKARDFTMIYWCEAGEFKEQRSLTTLFLSLRGMGHPPDDFVMLIDANPPDEGQDHFLFKNFYELRLSTDVNEEQKAFQKCLHVQEWSMADNPYMSEDEKNAIKGAYSNDPELYDRYIRGMWRKAIRDALFADIFKPAIHVFGTNEDGMLLLPTENCTELATSHDAGGVNPVSYIIERTVSNTTYKDKEGKEKTRPVSYFQFLDELAFIGKEEQIKKLGHEVTVAEFTRLEMDKMEFWEHELEREIHWKHYADNSALNFKESIVNRTVADEMFAVSEGKIKLIGVEKGSGSVGLRIRLWRKLLMENRIIISGLKCPKLIEMNKCIKRGMNEGTIQKGTPHKHLFDAASYYLMFACWDEVQKMVQTVRINARKANGSVSNLVNVRL